MRRYVRASEALDGLGTCEEDVQCTGGVFCPISGHVEYRNQGGGYQAVHVEQRYGVRVPPTPQPEPGWLLVAREWFHRWFDTRWPEPQNEHLNILGQEKQ